MFLTHVVILGLMVVATMQLEAVEPIWVEPAVGNADSGPGIRDAIARASALGAGGEVKLRAGVFRVSSSADDNWFIVAGGSDLTISGVPGKTEIVFTDPQKGGILVPGATRLTIRDLIIDYDPPPFTQGTVLAVDPSKGEFDLEVDAGFPSPDEPWFATGNPVSQMGVLFDAKQRRLKRAAPDYFIATSWRKQGADKWTIHLSGSEPGKATYISPGDRFVLLSRRGNGAFLFAFTTDCVLENVTVHASPSLTVSLTGSDRMTVRKLAITYRAATTRLIASNGDGVHCQQNRRGMLMENCLFEGLCDDGVNVYAPPLVVKQVVSPVQIAVTNHCPVRAGDRLQVFDPQQGMIRGEPLAMSVVVKDDLQVITLDAPVAGMVAGADHRSADTVFNLSASGAGYVFRNNHFRNHRRFGLNLRAGDGLIENNTFEELGGCGISIGNEPTWPEGPAARNVVIRNNQFIGGAYSVGYGDGKPGPGITVCGLSLHGLAQPPLLRRIRIENNRFTRASDPAISIRSARDITVQGNRRPDAEDELVNVHVEASEAVQVEGK